MERKPRLINRADKLDYNYEIAKFEYIKEEITTMLRDDSFSEQDWQKIITKFILIIYPKYLCVIEGLNIYEFYSKHGKKTNRFIDIALIDSDGNIDVIEIKKPFPKCLITQRQYRNNYVPKYDLSGSIMQLEKYIFYLNKMGKDGEKYLNEKNKDALPENIQLKITNPKGIAILGRDTDFQGNQKLDFEIIRRKYSNIVDIITYDDLLHRLDNIITKFKILADKQMPSSQ